MQEINRGAVLEYRFHSHLENERTEKQSGAVNANYHSTIKKTVSQPANFLQCVFLIMNSTQISQGNEPSLSFSKTKVFSPDSDYIAETIHNNQKKACCSLVLCYSHMQRFSLCLTSV